MTTHRDSGQQTLTGKEPPYSPPAHATGPTLNDRLKDAEAHIDRLYNKYYDIWDAVEKLSEGIAQTVPLPLKYK